MFKKFFGLFLIFLGLIFFSFNIVLLSSLIDEETRTISDICLKDLRENYNSIDGYKKCLIDGTNINISVQSISLILNLVSFISGLFFVYKGINFLRS